MRGAADVLGSLGIVTSLLVAACSSDTTAPGGIGVALNPSTISVNPGGSGDVGVTVRREGTFAGDVTLTPAQLQPGFTVTPNPAIIPSIDTTGTITVGVDAAVNPGDYRIAIDASGSGVPTLHLNLNVTVVPPGRRTGNREKRTDRQ